MTTYISTVEHAARIRQIFKNVGLSFRQVSVVSSSGSIRITIKSSLVPFAWAKKVASRAENISRCEITGDILSGGNRFVSVGHSKEAEAQLAARYESAVVAALAKIADEPNSWIERIKGSANVGIAKMESRCAISLWYGDRHGIELHSQAKPSDIAFYVALQDRDQVDANVLEIPAEG